MGKLFKNSNSFPKFRNIHIENAGLIILHPFLAPIFDELNLSVKGIWIDKNCQNKAILLTQYLVTGNEVFAESDFVLNKLLCGFPLEEKININVKITAEEKEICKNLLTSVISLWTALKNANENVLRNSFLQRLGILVISPTSIKLFIGSSAVDFLLESLPWNTGFVKTPWMKDLLQIEWNSYN